MKTIGLIGGMSWESTVTYYQIINQTIKAKLGGLHSAPLLLYSVDFAVIEECQSRGAWDESAEILSKAARNLEQAGADYIIICTNTMHKVAPYIERAVGIPLLHIADAAASVAKAHGVTKVGLLGTKFTMEQDFYRERLACHGIARVIPGLSDRDIIHKVIYEELCLGKVEAASRREFVRIIRALAEDGAGGVVLGCTEIPLLVRQEDVSIPVFDTTMLHVEAALDFALQR